MGALLSTCDEDWKGIEKKDDSSQMHSTFTDIYELLSRNETLVKTEWAILLQLVQKKYMKQQKKEINQQKIFRNCCMCKKIHIDDTGQEKDIWMEVENFLKEEMGILLSSTYCPKCAQTVQEDLSVQIDRLKA